MSADCTFYRQEAPVPAPRGPVLPALGLFGGPPEGPPPEVDAALTWLFAQSGWGRCLVIGADGSDEYARHTYQNLPPPHPISVDTLIFHAREAAYDPQVLQILGRADLLFIQGGDQWDYIRLWRDTPVQEGIHRLLRRGIPLAGSSAGLAVMGEFLFTARNGSVSASEALANPYDECVTLERAFIDSPHLAAPYAFLRNLITDTHFHDRKRMGRLLAFMARLAQDGLTPAARAIAVDELTAVLVDAQGSAKVVDQRPADQRGSACFLQAPGLPGHCRPGEPLLYEDVAVYQMRAGDAEARFDLATWQGRGGHAYRVSARAGAVCAAVAK